MEGNAGKRRNTHAPNKQIGTNTSNNPTNSALFVEQPLYPYLQTRVDLINHVVPCECAPIAAGLGHDGWYRHLVPDVCRSLQDIEIETSADVPRYMAVTRPHSWVIHVKLDHDVCRHGGALSFLYNLDIPSERISSVGDTSVPSTKAFV